MTAGDSQLRQSSCGRIHGKAGRALAEKLETVIPGTRPLFVSANRGGSGICKSRCRKGIYPRHLKVVTRSWNKSELYWILDLGKGRPIVKGTAGGSNGRNLSFLAWCQQGICRHCLRLLAVFYGETCSQSLDSQIDRTKDTDAF